MTYRLAAPLLVLVLAACAGQGVDQAVVPAVTSPASVPTTPATTPPTSAPAPSPAPPPPPPPTPKPAPPAPVAVDRRVAVVPGAATTLGAPPGPQVDQRPSAVAPPAQRYAVLVGITNYRSPTHDTIAGASDVRLFRTMLLEAGWLPQNIHLLADGQATGDAMRAQLRWLAARSTPGTFTLFHYSGHVKQRGGGREALWPVDRDFIDDRVVGTLLGRGTGRLWVDIAGCEAGSFAGDLPSSRVLFTGSSRGDQKAYEYPPWGLSVWTGLLLDRGTRQRAADADGDGRVTIGEATRYATYYAQGITLTQRPYGRQTPVTLGDPQRGWTLADPPA